jgi:pimeloyl-ACP methyl ester carboxylesterase
MRQERLRGRAASFFQAASKGSRLRLLGGMLLLLLAPRTHAADVQILKADALIDGADAGVKLFVRSKMAAGAKPTRDNTVLFVHGATYPSVPDFDFQVPDYSWADWMVRHGWVVYMFDVRNYGSSSREPAMAQPASANRPLSRSYLAIRDIGSVVDYIKAKHHVDAVSLVGWSWGAMTAGYYTSLHTERVRKLVLYAPLYNYPQHPNQGAGSKLQNKRQPWEFAFDTVGAYRLITAAECLARWDAEIPVTDKSQYREQSVAEAYCAAVVASDPQSGTRSPASQRAPNGVQEDTFMAATGRPVWNASSIYVPVLVIAGEFDTYSFPVDREGLMRDLSHAPSKRSVLLKNATHFVLLEKSRFELYGAIDAFLKE